MKFFVVLVSLFAAVQAEIFLSAPGNHSIIRAGRNMTVEIIVPIDTVIGILLCLHVGAVVVYPGQPILECGSRPSGSQPCIGPC